MGEDEKKDYRLHLINTIDNAIDNGISVYDLDVVNKKAIRHNYINKQAVIDRMEELKDRLKNNKKDLNKNPDPINSKFNSFDDYFEWKHKILEENKLIKLRIKDLQELLEGERK